MTKDQLSSLTPGMDNLIMVKPETSKKKELRDIYQMTGMMFRGTSGIAKFGLKNSEDTLPPGPFYMYWKMPEGVNTIKAVRDWLDQPGEDSPWIDVDLKYKLLQQARKWKALQDGYPSDYPRVSLKMANAQERYNLTVLAQQDRLQIEFTFPPDSDMQKMRHAR